MQLGADVTQALRHSSFDGRMHVLVGRVEREATGGDLLSHLAKGFPQGRRLAWAQQPGVLERARVRDRGFDVLRRKANIDGQTARKRDR
ncbi:MAG: hypothetical protein E6G55_00275, partial [Actinobacteria bacterium]